VAFAASAILHAQAPPNPPARPPGRPIVVPGVPLPPPIQYRFSFPESQHRWMQVEAEFNRLTQPSVELRMSRSSPGRYSIHDFAKNVYDVHAFGEDGKEIATTRPDPSGWSVSGFGARLVVKYKVYGDSLDGTYLAVDETHAHINMPSVIMWARGLDLEPIRIVFDQPPGQLWGAATQLRRVGTAGEFTAPNLQYLMDSPAEFGSGSLKQFESGGARFLVAVHHLGTDAELDDFTQDLSKIVEQEGLIYGEFPDYENGYYTFIGDYLPWAGGDGMEHRNSTVMTAPLSLKSDRLQALDIAAHEFFHGWNIERIRPAGIEPFDFDRANMTDLLWLGEGFTQYYGPLAMRRAQVVDQARTLSSMAGLIVDLALSPAHDVRSAVEMSRMAPFIDGGRPNDRTNWDRAVTSYYPFGGAIALALDLTLRERSNGDVSLDDFMRAMWTKFGKPSSAGSEPPSSVGSALRRTVPQGYVDHPYTVADAEATLGEVSRDPAFAHDFFTRYITGHEVADYARLLARAGVLLRKRNAGHAWLGGVRLDARGGALHIATLVEPNWPLYASGIEQDDELRQVDGQRVSAPADLEAILAKHKPGDRVDVAFTDRAGTQMNAPVTLAEDPALEAVAVETTGSSLTPAQKTFRDRWLGPK
jgi:predicted metalloprotease with PDZ domain